MMRTFAVALLVLSPLSTNSTVRAAQANGCKQCGDEQRTCRSNYSATTCKSQYDLCIKSCQKK